MSLLLISFVLLTVKLYLDISKKSKEDERIKEELLMELSVTEDGEEYVIKNSPTSKKYRKMLRKEHFDFDLTYDASDRLVQCVENTV